MQEINFRCSCFFKSIAVDKGILKPLPCEDLLGIFTFLKATVEIDETIMTRAIQARTRLTELSKSEAPKDADEFKAMCEKHEARLKLMDTDWQVEEEIMSMLVGDQAEQRTCEKLIAMMPSAAKRKDPTAVAAEINAFRSSEMHKLAPLNVQQGVEQIYKWTLALASETSVNPSTGVKTPLVAQVFTHFQFFLQRPDSTNKKHTLCGANAMLQMITEIEKQRDANKLVKSDADKILQFRWLIPQVQETAVMNIVIQARNSGAKTLKKAVPKSSGASSSSKGASSSSAGGKKEDTAMAQAMAFLS